MNPYHRIQEEERAKKKREVVAYIETLQPHLVSKDIAIGVDDCHLIFFSQGQTTKKPYKTSSLALASFENFRKEFCLLLQQ